jgi:hypothetical protein
MAYASGELTMRDFVRAGGYIGAFGTIIILLVLGIVRG